jgi:hypothetical protein
MQELFRLYGDSRNIKIFTSCLLLQLATKCSITITKSAVLHIFQVPNRHYAESTNLNSFTASLHLELDIKSFYTVTKSAVLHTVAVPYQAVR